MENEDNINNNLSDEYMEIALQDFYLQDKYTTSDIIKYTLMVIFLNQPIKSKLTFHSNYNKLFFDDLKNSRFLGRLFKDFPSSSWLEGKFRLIKYKIHEFLSENDEKFQILLQFLNEDETIHTVYFKNFSDKFDKYLERNYPQFHNNIPTKSSSYSTPFKPFNVKIERHLPSTNVKTQVTDEEYLQEQNEILNKSENRLLFATCDIEENIKNKSDNIYSPNKFFYTHDLEQARLIENLLKEIRNNFDINADDDFIIREIFCRLNFDVDEIFLYLSNPIQYEYLIWTDEDDQILKNSILNNIFENSFIERKNGVERINKRINFLQL